VSLVCCDRTSDTPRLLAFPKLLGDEGERDLSHFTPPMVNGQGMSAIGDFAELRDSGIVFLQLVSRRDDRQRDGMVFLARDEQEGSTRGVPGVELVFRPRIEVSGSSLEDWRAGTGDRKHVVEGVGFVFLQRISKAVPELLEGQGDGPMVVGGIAQHGRAGLELGERQRQHAAKPDRIDGDRHGGEAFGGQLLRDEAAEGMADDGGLPLELLDGLGIVLRCLLNPLAGKDLRVVIRLCDGLRVIGPARCESRIALLFKERTPGVSTG
jgi:hypothetical protein